MKAIRNWCEELIVAAIISIIIEMFVPDGNTKKYIRVVSSIYIIFVIIYPILNNFSNIENFYENIINENNEKDNPIYENSVEVSNMYNSNDLNKLNELYCLAIEDEIKNNFDCVKDINIILSDNLKEIEKIEIILNEHSNLSEELKQKIINEYEIEINKISILQ